MTTDRLAAVLFDMDGTLVESSAAIDRAWTQVAHEAGVAPARILAIHAGRTAHHTLREVLPDLADDDLDRLARRQLALQYDDLDGVVALPGAHDLLAHLHAAGVPWAVVTSADGRLARARLGAVGIDALVLITADDVTHSKPDPEGYRLAASRLGVDPTRCLVVEDAASGVAAGRAAGALTAGVGSIDSDLPVADLVELSARLVVDADGLRLR